MLEGVLRYVEHGVHGGVVLVWTESGGSEQLSLRFHPPAGRMDFVPGPPHSDVLGRLEIIFVICDHGHFFYYDLRRCYRVF